MRATVADCESARDCASSADATLRIYEGAKHQLLQDLPHIVERVMSDLTNWIVDHL